jgi:fluoride exporter
MTSGTGGSAGGPGRPRRPLPRGATRWPVDPEVEVPAAGEPPTRGLLPRIHPRAVVAVAVGGLAGGALRYAVGLWQPASRTGFPWAVFAVNTAGALLLALLLVLVLEVLPPTTYLRPLVGTGFCGALTTFSSVVTGADQLVARGHAGLAAGYLAASLGAGLAAAVCGAALGRAVPVRWRAGRQASTP